MGEVQDGISKNGKGEDGQRIGANQGSEKDEENEVAQGVIRRLRRSEPVSERNEGPPDLLDEELDVPNLEVPEDE